MSMIRRVSPVMPAPTLDSLGRPQQPWQPTSTVNVLFGRPRLLINSVDVTYFRGVPFQLDSISDEEPFGDVTAQITFPQITAFEQLGVGALDWLVDFAPVLVQIVAPDDVTVLEQIWAGNLGTVETVDGSSRGLVLACQGKLFQAGLTMHQPLFFIDTPQDIGAVVPAELNNTPQRRFPTIGAVTTGIGTTQRGDRSQTRLDYAQALLATATDPADGKQWTVAQNPGATTYVMRKKDTTTVHATYVIGTAGLEVDLTRDPTQAPNAIYGEWTTPDGCFPGETLIAAEHIEQGWRRHWSGDLVTIRTARGHKLSATPNHPILTPIGWVAASALNEGDRVISNVVADRDAVAMRDVQKVPARIEQVVGTLAKLGTVERIPIRAMEFHGDISDGQVYVVRPDSPLRDHNQTSILEPFGEPFFVDASLDQVALSANLGLLARCPSHLIAAIRRHARGLHNVRGRGATMLHRMFSKHAPDDVLADAQVVRNGLGSFTGDVPAHDRGVVHGEAPSGDSSRRLSSFWRRVRHAFGHSLGGGTQNTALAEPERDGLRVNREVTTNGLSGLTGEISPDYVVHVERTPWSGHVYNLQTAAGKYTAGGIIVSNCVGRNSKYPNLLPDAAPAYPFTNPSNVITVGTTDAGTDSGNGVSTWQQRMHDIGYPVTVTGTYSTSDAGYCKREQAAAGISVDGIVGPQTWAATFDVGANGGDLSGAYFAPIAVDTAVEPNLYTATGAISGPNPAWVPSKMRVERFEQLGDGIGRDQAIASAAAELAAAADPGLVGTLRATIDPEEQSRWLLRAGQNILLKHYRGTDVMLHIAKRTISGQSAEFTVDSKARDALTLAQIIERNNATKLDPARQYRRPTTATTTKTNITWDCEAGAGTIPRFALFGGLWSVIRIPMAEYGTVARSTVQTASPLAEFALLAFEQPITAADLVSIVGDPLASGNNWSTDQPTQDALDAHGLRMAWGSGSQPAGYSPGSFSNTSDPLTGLLDDTASWQFVSSKPPWIWLAFYSETSCFVSGTFEQAVI